MAALSCSLPRSVLLAIIVAVGGSLDYSAALRRKVSIPRSNSCER